MNSLNAFDHTLSLQHYWLTGSRLPESDALTVAPFGITNQGLSRHCSIVSPDSHRPNNAAPLRG